MRYKNYRDQLKDAKRSNDMYAALAGKDPLDYGDMIREPKKRAPKDANDPSEHAIQVAIINWWRMAHQGFGLPEFALAAIPNGGARDPITGARLKAEGVRKGTPDLMLPVPRAKYRGLFLEMKTRTGAVKDEQIDWSRFLNAQGYLCVISRSVEDAIKTITVYLHA